MSTPMHDLLEQAAGTPEMPVDLEAALRRGDHLRRRRQLAVGALASVVVLAATGLAIQLPGGVPIPEVADQDEREPSDLQYDADPPHPILQPEELRDVAAGRLGDGRAWTARVAHTGDYLCLLFSISDRELVDTCSGNPDDDRSIFVASVADRPGGAEVTIGYVGGAWRAPVEFEFADSTTVVADLHEIESDEIESEGSGTRFLLAEHEDRSPTHVVVGDEHGERQRFPVQP